MSELNASKRLTGALLSGVIYLDEQGSVENVHWCLTADGDGAALDIQPVIRTGNLTGVSELFSAMLEELADRFAQAAAVEAAKAANAQKNKKASAKTVAPPVPEPDAQLQDTDAEDSGDEIEAENSESDVEPERVESEPEMVPVQPAVPAADKNAPDLVKKRAKPAPSMSSLFDSLDMS